MGNKGSTKSTKQTGRLSLKQRLFKSVKAPVRRVLFNLLSKLPPEMRDTVIRKQVQLPDQYPDDFTVKIADTKEELEQAFSLLHDCYVEVGAMSPQENGLRVTPYHALPSTVVVVAKRNDKVIGTVSLIRDNPLGLPMESDFNVDHLRKKYSIAEISSLAVNNSYRGDRRTVAFSLFKFLYSYSKHNFRTEGFVLSTAVRRKEFFRSIFLFQEIHNNYVANYDFANGIPSVGMYVIFSEFELRGKSVYKQFPKHQDVYSFISPEKEGGAYIPQLKYPARPEYEAFNNAMTPELLQYFFRQKTGVFHKLSDREKLVIANCYPFSEYRSALPELGSLYPPNPARAPRFEVSGTVTVLDRNNSRIYGAQALDVSRTGIRLKSPREDLDIASPCRLQVSLAPHLPTFSVEATLVWHNDTTYGFEIQEADEKWSMLNSNLEASFRSASKWQAKESKKAERGR